MPIPRATPRTRRPGRARPPRTIAARRSRPPAGRASGTRLRARPAAPGAPRREPALPGQGEEEKRERRGSSPTTARGPDGAAAVDRAAPRARSSAMTRADTPWRATILTLYPEMFPGPARRVALGRRARPGRLEPGGAQHPRARPRPPPLRGRHAGRRRRRDGAALRRARRRDRRRDRAGRSAAPAADVAPRPAAHPGAGARPRRGARAR